METGKWKLENGNWKMETGKWKLENDPLTRPATAGESAVAVHPLPQGGES
jgi:hypothetical protein